MYVAIDMRMAIDEFVALLVGYLAKVETTLLLAQLRVEHNMQKQVAQLFLDALHIAIGDSINQLVSLLYSVVAQRLEGLLSIPGALLAQSIHYLQKSRRTL